VADLTNADQEQEAEQHDQARRWPNPEASTTQAFPRCLGWHRWLIAGDDDRQVWLR